LFYSLFNGFDHLGNDVAFFEQRQHVALGFSGLSPLADLRSGFSVYIHSLMVVDVTECVRGWCRVFYDRLEGLLARSGSDSKSRTLFVSASSSLNGPE
jgi:hypothetical protein